MTVPTFIVECGICQQAWEVTTFAMSAPGRWLVIPDHEMLDRKTSVPISGLPCPGPQLPGLGVGGRAAWERNWSLRHMDRPHPSVFDGAGIKLTT